MFLFKYHASITILCLLTLSLNHEIAVAQSDVLYLKKHTNLNIEVVEGKLQMHTHHLIEKEFYSNFEKNSRETVFYSDFTPLVELEATTLIPYKSRFKKVRVTNKEVKDLVQPGIFYGGYKRLDFVYPSLENQSVGQLEYTQKIEDPFMLSGFFFADDYEIREAVYSISFPDEVKISYKLFGEDTEKIIFQKRRENDRNIYSWTMNNVPKFVNEKKAPGRTYFTPHIIPFINSYTSNGIQMNVANNVNDLFHWYRQHISNIKPYSDVELRKLVEDITRELDSDYEKSKTIFQWVQKNIKYVAFEDGMAGFIPRAAGDVYNKRYGDCKDMANLLKTMLNMVGIEAYHTWIGTRDRSYSYNDVPSTIVDNHMICTTTHNGEYLFLDATNAYVPFGQPSSMIQGKEALISKNLNEFEIVKVPVSKARESVRKDDIEVSVINNNLTGTFVCSLTGHKKVDLIYDKQKAQILGEQEYLRDHFSIGDNNILIQHEQFNGLDNKSDTAKVKFDITLPDFCRKIGNTTYINLNLDKSLPGEKIDLQKRNYPVEESYCYTYISSVKFRIPENSSVDYLPEDIEFSGDNIKFSAKYHIEDNYIRYTKIYTSNFLYLQKSDFEQWNKSLETMVMANQESIILKSR